MGSGPVIAGLIIGFCAGVVACIAFVIWLYVQAARS